MKKIVHFSLMALKHKDRSACGLDLEKASWRVGASVDPKDVTCKNCKHSKIYKEAK